MIDEARQHLHYLIKTGLPINKAIRYTLTIFPDIKIVAEQEGKRTKFKIEG